MSPGKTLLAVSFLAFSLPGNTAPKYTPPKYLSPDFQVAEVTTLAVLPVLDLRADRSEALELDAWVHRIGRYLIKRRGYQTTFYGDRTMIESLQQLSQAELVEAQVQGLRVPEVGRWLLVFGLVDSYARRTFGSSGNAEMVAYIVDQQEGRVLWRHDTIGQIGMAGPVGRMMKGLMERSGIEVATKTLIESIPLRR
jgi:hypothetical protein